MVLSFSSYASVIQYIRQINKAGCKYDSRHVCVVRVCACMCVCVCACVHACVCVYVRVYTTCDVSFIIL